jgi:hypothetical protein
LALTSHLFSWFSLSFSQKGGVRAKAQRQAMADARRILPSARIEVTWFVPKGTLLTVMFEFEVTLPDPESWKAATKQQKQEQTQGGEAKEEEEGEGEEKKSGEAKEDEEEKEEEGEKKGGAAKEKEKEVLEAVGDRFEWVLVEAVEE